MNIIAEIMKRDRCSFTEATKKAGLEIFVPLINRTPNRNRISLEEGLTIYEKWKTGPFTDTDGTDRLETWMWENVDQLFKLVELMVESEKSAWANEQLSRTSNHESPESPEILP